MALLRPSSFGAIRRHTCGRLLAATFVPLLFILAVTSAASVASAQGSEATSASDADARTFFKSASVRFERGDYEAALKDFEAAYELSRRPALLYNIGLCAERVGEDAKALSAYRQYLEADANGELTSEVRGRVTTLEARLNRRNAGSSPVASPEEAARAAATTEPSTSPSPDSANGPQRKKWWLWTGVGGAVIAAVLTGVLVASAGGDVSDPKTDLGTFTVGEQ